MKIAFDIADAVAALLNEADAGTFSQDFTAARRCNPFFEVAELTSLQVSVAPLEFEGEQTSRGTPIDEVAINVGLHKKVSVDDDDVASCCEVVQEAVQYLRAQRTLSAVENTQFLRIKNSPIYSMDHLVEQRVFFSVIEVRYKVVIS